MIKIAKIFLFLGGFFFLMVSCEKANTLQSKEIASNNTTEKDAAITPDVQMVLIKGGDYQPFYGEDSTLVKVDDFLLDERPVTNAEFLDFVKKNPQWKRSEVQTIYVDDTYLKDWQDDETLPKDADPNAAVVSVSWFAAKAYAKSAGKRLPTLDEWEYVAMADEKRKDARTREEFNKYILSWYEKNKTYNNSVGKTFKNYWGVYDMHGLVWEWTFDFNSIFLSGESRKDKDTDKDLFCGSGSVNATDLMNYAAFMRYAFRGSIKANYTTKNLGFRCAKNIAN